MVIAAVAALLIGLGVGLSVAFSRGGSAGFSVDFAKIPGLQTGAPPWNDGIATLQEKLPLIQLSPLTAEGTALHIHQHLDVYVNGKRVTVPADIGIFGTEFLTEIHTHDTSGLIHVESPTQTTFALGQFFAEWGVRVNSNCLGRYCGHLRWWVDGKQRTGNPADLALGSHQEIVIVVGQKPARIPSTFNWPPRT